MCGVEDVGCASPGWRVGRAISLHEAVETVSIVKRHVEVLVAGTGYLPDGAYPRGILVVGEVWADVKDILYFVPLCVPK